MVSNSSGFGDAGPLPAVQLIGVTNVNVVAPSFGISNVFAPVHVGAYEQAPNNEPEISLGTQLNMPGSVGVQSTYKISMPAGYGGAFGPNQTLEWSRSVSPAALATPYTSGGEFQLDACALMADMWNGSSVVANAVPTVGAGGSATFGPTLDAPNSGQLYSTAQSERDQKSFVDTLMFKPTVGPNGSIKNAIWVPLTAYVWGYDATAVNNNGTWSWAASPMPSQQPAPGTYAIPTPAPTPAIFTVPANFPTWPAVAVGAAACPAVP